MVLLELAANGSHHVCGVERERDLLAMRTPGALLECLAADEIVIELDVRSVAELPRREVVVLDVRRIEAAADRRVRLVTIGREPLPIGLHPVARIDGR